MFPQEATLIEIVFAISVQHQAVVYVVDRDNGLLGVITQAQHGKSLHDLTEKMGYSTRRKNSAYKEGI